ncbi:cdc42 effector protein 1 [Lepisosteus oculatus]|uniref:cdc42 effector protein 1 n=1 Tax=Lepisosteus oculatus TaxID=7918 RepID=UPI0035F51D7A
MSLGKLPGLKGLVPQPQGRRRYRSELTVDMISPPLGDFRHTMHVGRGGDVFGDTSFLSNHGGAGGDPETPERGAKAAGFFSRTLRHVRKTPARARGGSRELSPPPPPVSPIIKNAVSLPQLDVGTPNGSPRRALFPGSPGSPPDTGYSYGVHSGFVTLPRLSRSDKQLQETPDVCDSELRRDSLQDSGSLSLARSDSLQSFTFDLGPSLMSEVLGLIDSPDCSLGANQGWGEEKSTASEPVTVSPAGQSEPPSADGSPLVEDLRGQRLNGGGSPYCEDQDSMGELEFEKEEALTRAAPDVVLGSPCRVEPGMEAERFQRAADVLARHYGGSGFLKGQQQTEGRAHQFSPDADSSTALKRAPYAYPEEEDEIKV